MSSTSPPPSGRDGERPNDESRSSDLTRRDRFTHSVRTESDDIQDWINASGGMVMAGVLVFIALFGLYVLVFA